MFAGRRLGRDLDFLIDIFKRGEHTNHVHNGLKKLGVSGGLPQFCWERVTNQAFEARVDNGNKAAQAECSFWTKTATPVELTDNQSKEGIDDMRIKPLTSGGRQHHVRAVAGRDIPPWCESAEELPKA